jgi:hypothetical protein
LRFKAFSRIGPTLRTHPKFQAKTGKNLKRFSNLSGSLSILKVGQESVSHATEGRSLGLRQPLFLSFFSHSLSDIHGGTDSL